jgi:hypothetical protein
VSDSRPEDIPQDMAKAGTAKPSANAPQGEGCPFMFMTKPI